MPNLAQITIAGHIGGNAETKQVNDTTVTEFSVAVNDRQDNTTWYRVSVWGRYGEILQPKIVKGKVVTVIGDFVPRPYTANDGTNRYSFDIRANAVVTASEGEQVSGGQADLEDIPFHHDGWW